MQNPPSCRNVVPDRRSSIRRACSSLVVDLLYKALSTLAILVAVFGDIVADFGRGRRRVDEV